MTYNAAHSEPDPYAITAPLEILSVLKSLQKGGTLVRMHGRRPNTSIITSVLEIRYDDGQIILDNARDDVINHRIVDGERALCEASLESVNVRFPVTDLQACMHEGRPALSAAFPAELSRVQRREAFRIKTPIANPVLCHIPLNEHKPSDTVALTLDDISASGIGVYENNEQLGELERGRLFRHCSLALPGIPPLKLDLQLAYFETLEPVNGKTRRRLGFSFVRPSGAIENQIQRYVTTLERELIARRRGLA